MSTLDYFAQPNLILSSKRLLATRLLNVLPGDESQPLITYNLNHKNNILKGGLGYLRSVGRGYDAVCGMGIHAVTCHESKCDYEDVLAALGNEAKSRHFHVKIDGYCKTLEDLLDCKECPKEKIDEVRSFFEKITKLKVKEEPPAYLSGISHVA
jgi:hypothetical protein